LYYDEYRQVDDTPEEVQRESMLGYSSDREVINSRLYWCLGNTERPAAGITVLVMKFQGRHVPCRILRSALEPI